MAQERKTSPLNETQQDLITIPYASESACQHHNAIVKFVLQPPPQHHLHPIRTHSVSASSKNSNLRTQLDLFRVMLLIMQLGTWINVLRTVGVSREQEDE